MVCPCLLAPIILSAGTSSGLFYMLKSNEFMYLSLIVCIVLIVLYLVMRSR